MLYNNNHTTLLHVKVLKIPGRPEIQNIRLAKQIMMKPTFIAKYYVDNCGKRIKGYSWSYQTFGYLKILFIEKALITLHKFHIVVKTK